MSRHLPIFNYCMTSPFRVCFSSMGSTPHYVYSYMLENIQRRAAWWASGCYDRCSSVSDIIASLKWPSLAQHHKVTRLILFHNIMYDISVLSLPLYYLATQRFLRHQHPLHLTQSQTNTAAYQYS